MKQQISTAKQHKNKHNRDQNHKKLDKKKGIKKTKVTPFFCQKQYKKQSEKKNRTKKTLKRKKREDEEEKEGGTED